MDLVALGVIGNDVAPEILNRIEIDIKYGGYIDRQKREASQFKKMQNVTIPVDLDYDSVHGLSRELTERLKEVRPETLGQASRVPGITPAAMTALMVGLRARS